MYDLLCASVGVSPINQIVRLPESSKPHPPNCYQGNDCQVQQICHWKMILTKLRYTEQRPIYMYIYIIIHVLYIYNYYNTASDHIII